MIRIFLKDFSRPKFAKKDYSLKDSLREVDIFKNDTLVGKFHKLYEDCVVETAEHPAYFIAGWKSWLELCYTTANAIDVEELTLFGILVIMDPSKENYLQAIEHKKLMGNSKGPFIWSGDKLE